MKIKKLIQKIIPRFDFLEALKRGREIKKLEERLQMFDWVVPEKDKNGMTTYSQCQKEAKRIGADELYYIAKRQQQILRGFK